MENEFEMGGIFVNWEIFHSHFMESFGKMEMEWKPFCSNGGGLVKTVKVKKNMHHHRHRANSVTIFSWLHNNVACHCASTGTL